MSRVSYEQARADHEYLWETYAPASDMTGGYVDSDDLKTLLESPTKATARDCYVRQIHYWFEAGPDLLVASNEEWRSDPRVREICSRHDADDHHLSDGAPALD